MAVETFFSRTTFLIQETQTLNKKDLYGKYMHVMHYQRFYIKMLRMCTHFYKYLCDNIGLRYNHFVPCTIFREGDSLSHWLGCLCIQFYIYIDQYVLKQCILHLGHTSLFHTHLKIIILLKIHIYQHLRYRLVFICLRNKIFLKRVTYLYICGHHQQQCSGLQVDNLY